MSLAGLVMAACAPAPAAYTGSQARTPVDKIPDGGQLKNFQLVGQNPLVDPKFNLPQGMNGGITAAGKCLYVGSNTALHNASVLDMSDMTKPVKVGEIPGIQGRGMGIEKLEAVPDLNLLVVSVRPSFGIGNVKPGSPKFDYKFPVKPEEKTIGATVYDISDCTKPVMVAKIDVTNENTHYLNLWRDPNKPDRVLVLITFDSGVPADGVDFRVYDLAGCPKTCSPKLAGSWGLRAQLGVPAAVTTQYPGGTRVDNTQTHDAIFSLDGRRIHLAQLAYGYLQIDSSALAEGRPCKVEAARSKDATGHCLTVFPNFKPLAAFGTEVALVHGVVPIPGRPYVVLNHEGHACPFGGLTFAYIGDKEGFSTYNRQNGIVGPAVAPGGNVAAGAFRGDLFPRNVGTFSIPEQNADRCPKPGDTVPASTGATGLYGADMLRSSKTVHNSLAFPSVMFSTWYGGGLRAVDITNPYTPFEVGYFFNKPAPEVRWCAEGAAGPCDNPEVDSEGVPVRQKQLLPPDVFARSFPILMNGYIVYSDENMGVYVLKYTGPHAEELPQKGICIAENPNVHNVGFEPCAPFKTWSP